jgi:3-methylcrotonyl-CoA carboxylase alpha subunit
MRRVNASNEFEEMLLSCQREAASSFGDDRVIIEKYIERPRHIEVQVFGDRHGNVVHLFERDCSLQRRHQKVIEEAPAPGMDQATRAAVCDAAVKAAKAVDYVGAGTIEFIADASDGLRADRIWFMEMNTRLQVEHAVTEEITGVDLVEWQLQVASGEELPKRQEELSIHGWAMEARLYAEDPSKGFLPSTGRLDHLMLPEHLIRVETGVEEGGDVSPYYDPMIAKLVAHCDSRAEVIETLAQAASVTAIWPVKTNAGFIARALRHPDFIAGEVDTNFIPARLDLLVPVDEPSSAVLQAAAMAMVHHALGGRMPHQVGSWVRSDEDSNTPWIAAAGFRLNGARERTVRVQSGGIIYSVEVEDADGALPAWIEPFGDMLLSGANDGLVFALQVPRPGGNAAGAVGDGAIVSPMPGKIIALEVAAGEAVTTGQKLLTLEAMKMEHSLVAPFDGVVAELNASEGAQVSEGALLARIGKGEG